METSSDKKSRDKSTDHERIWAQFRIITLPIQLLKKQLHHDKLPTNPQSRQLGRETYWSYIIESMDQLIQNES
jgi:hypothetical protein